MTQTLIAWIVPIEIVGALVGVVLTAVLVGIARQLGGVVRAALNNLIIGVALFTVAFIAAALLQGFNVTAMENTMVVHMILMILALIMIVLSARALTALVR